MFEMVSSHTMRNLALTENDRALGACGVIFKASLKAKPVPSFVSILLENAQHTIVFRWDKKTAEIGISIPVISESSYGVSQIVRHGQTHKHIMDITGGYPSMDVVLSVVGRDISATLRENYKTVASIDTTVLDDPSIDVINGWKVRVQSYPTDTASGFELSKYSIACDESTSGRIITEYFTLSAEDISRKYITLSEPPSRSISLNVAQATTQRRGVDFAVIDRCISWKGYGIDQPRLMKVGIGIRVTYTTGAWGVPWVDRTGKNLVGLSSTTQGNIT